MENVRKGRKGDEGEEMGKTIKRKDEEGNGVKEGREKKEAKGVGRQEGRGEMIKEAREGYR